MAINHTYTVPPHVCPREVSPFHTSHIKAMVPQFFSFVDLFIKEKSLCHRTQKLHNFRVNGLPFN